MSVSVIRPVLRFALSMPSGGAARNHREMVMLVMREHGVNDYAELAEMDSTDVGTLTDDDRECLREIGAYLVATDAWHRFAIWLLHKHFEPMAGEVFVERVNVRRRQTRTTPVQRAEFGQSELLPTALRFDGIDG